MLALKSRGFTLIELLIVVGLLAILFAFSTVGLAGILPRFTRLAGHDMLVSEVTEQQLRAMKGERVVSGEAAYYGVHIESTGFQIFQGQHFDVNHSTVQSFNFEPSFSIQNCTMPLQEIVFSPVTGLVEGLTSGEYSCDLYSQNVQYGTLYINRFGVTREVKL